MVVMASLQYVGSTGDLDIHGFLQNPLNNPAWCLALVLEPGFMLGYVPLGQSHGSFQLGRCYYCGSEVVQLSFSMWCVHIFLSFRDEKALLECCLQSVAWYRWKMELCCRLVALNSVKVMFSSSYPEVSSIAVLHIENTVLKAAGLLSPAEKHHSPLRFCLWALFSSEQG